MNMVIHIVGLINFRKSESNGVCRPQWNVHPHFHSQFNLARKRVVVMIRLHIDPTSSLLNWNRKGFYPFSSVQHRGRRKFIWFHHAISNKKKKTRKILSRRCSAPFRDKKKSIRDAETHMRLAPFPHKNECSHSCF